VSCDESVRRFAQDDDFVGVLKKRSRRLALMGLTSWAKLRRPCGTELGNGVLTHPRKASLDKVGHFVMRT
jgi:hypothetical protein